MPSNPTARGRHEKQGAGENSNTWGHVKLNGALDTLDEQIDGVETIALTTSPTALTATNYASDQQRNKGWLFTGTGTFTVTIPAAEQVKFVRNGCTGMLTLSNGTNSVAVASGKAFWIASDGTNIWRDTTVDDATTQATNAAASATSGATSATNAATSATSAANSATEAGNAATSASNSANLAASWATKNDAPVSGSDYSAKYHAQAAAASAASVDASNLVTIAGAQTVTGTKRFTGLQTNAWHHTSEGQDRFFFAAGAQTFYKASEHIFRDHSDVARMSLSGTGDLDITGSYKSNGVAIGGVSAPSSASAIGSLVIAASTASTAGTVINPGNTVAGSTLRYDGRAVGGGDYSSFGGSSSGATFVHDSAAPTSFSYSGTWRALGRCWRGPSMAELPLNIWQRIA